MTKTPIKSARPTGIEPVTPGLEANFRQARKTQVIDFSAKSHQETPGFTRSRSQHVHNALAVFS